MHVSCRNSSRPGWAYVTYDLSAGKRFSDEIVAVKIDSSGSVERFAHTHSEPDSIGANGNVHFTDGEPQAVPSRDGGRVLWASNWNRDCSGNCGPRIEFKDYLLDATCGGHFLVDSQQAASNGGGAGKTDRPMLLPTTPNPFATSTAIQFVLPSGALVRVEVFDAQGRRVARLANGYLLPGRHLLTWNRRSAAGDPVQPGVYICQLAAGSFRDQKQMVLLP